MKVSYKVLFAVALSVAGTNAFAADVSGLATTNYVKGAIGSLAGNVTGTGTVVKSISQTGGKITATLGKIGTADLDTTVTGAITNANSALQKSGVLTAGHVLKVAADGKTVTDGGALGTLATKSKIVDADVDDAAKIAVSKINGAQTTGNLVPNTGLEADGRTVKIIDSGSTTKYPSMAVAEAIAAKAASLEVMDITSRVNVLEGDYDTLSAKVESNQGTANDAIAKKQDKSTKLSFGGANGAWIDVTTAQSNAMNSGITSANVTQITTNKNDIANIDSKLANKADKSTVYTKTEVDTKVGTKQNTLKVGTNIKNGTNINMVQDDAGNITVNSTYSYSLPTATSTVKGGIMATSEIAVATDGKATIAANAVTTTKINDAAVTTAKLAGNAVTSAKIADDAVTTAKIKGFDNSGTTEECASGNCALVDLGSGAQWLPIVNEYK